MNLLDAEAARDELIGQVVQQFRMRRPAAHPAEIVGCVDDTPSEMIRPDPVDHHTSSQRIIRTSNPIGKFGARILSIFREFRSVWGKQDTGRPRTDAIASLRDRKS